MLQYLNATLAVFIATLGATIATPLLISPDSWWLLILYGVTIGLLVSLSLSYRYAIAGFVGLGITILSLYLTIVPDADFSDSITPENAARLSSGMFILFSAQFILFFKMRKLMREVNKKIEEKNPRK